MIRTTQHPTFDFDIFAHYYDADIGRFDADLPLYRELARRADGPVLDAMCGTGRVVLDLAANDVAAVGVDLSPAMIRVAEDKIAAQGLGDRARVLVGDVRRLALPDRFGLIAVPINSFMHLETVADQMAALRSIKEHLRPDGVLVLDLFNPDPRDLLNDQGVLIHDHTFTSADGATVQKWVLRRTDLAEQRQDVEFIYDEIQPDGRVIRRVMPFAMRWLYRFEVQHLLARVGLSVQAIYGDYDLEPYGSDSPQMIVVAGA